MNIGVTLIRAAARDQEDIRVHVIANEMYRAIAVEHVHAGASASKDARIRETRNDRAAAA